MPEMVLTNHPPAQSLGAQRRERRKKPLYIQITERERERVGKGRITLTVSVRLHDAMVRGILPTVQQLQAGGRLFGPHDAPVRQTLWVPAEVCDWVTDLADALQVAKTVCIRALVPEVFCDDVQPVEGVRTPVIPQNNRIT
jgi:hypothetical protein